MGCPWKILQLSGYPQQPPDISLIPSKWIPIPTWKCSSGISAPRLICMLPALGTGLEMMMNMGWRASRKHQVGMWRFPARHGGTPSSLDGLFHGQSQSKIRMITGGSPILGNHHVVSLIFFKGAALVYPFIQCHGFWSHVRWVSHAAKHTGQIGLVDISSVTKTSRRNSTAGSWVLCIDNTVIHNTQDLPLGYFNSLLWNITMFDR